jgi:hypothetical protein
MMKMPTITASQWDGDSWISFAAPPSATSAIGMMVQQSVSRVAPTDTMTAVYVGADNRVYTTSYTANSNTGQWSPALPITSPQDPVPNATPAIASDGTHTYVVYPTSDALLYCVVDGNTPINMHNDGISVGTSPALVAYNDVLYCLYQSYGSEGELWCMSSADSGETWNQINPPSTGYYGLSGSPSITLSTNTGPAFVMYQGYHTSGRLSGSAMAWSGSPPLLGWWKFVNNFEGFGLPPRYMSGSPSATVWPGGGLCVAMPSPDGSILVVRSDGPGWVLTSPGDLAPGTFPTLVSYDNNLLCFWLPAD